MDTKVRIDDRCSSFPMRQVPTGCAAMVVWRREYQSSAAAGSLRSGPGRDLLLLHPLRDRLGRHDLPHRPTAPIRVSMSESSSSSLTFDERRIGRLGAGEANTPTADRMGLVHQNGDRGKGPARPTHRRESGIPGAENAIGYQDRPRGASISENATASNGFARGPARWHRYLATNLELLRQPSVTL